MLWCLNNTKAIAQLKENTFNAFSLAVNDSSYCSYGGIGGAYQSLLVMTLGFSNLLGTIFEVVEEKKKELGRNIKN